MNAEKVDKFLLLNESKIPDYEISINQLLELDETKEMQLQTSRLISPAMMLLISIFFGMLGIDRLLLGEFKYGFLKLITLGGLGLWTLVDWFLIMDATKRHNLKKLNAIIEPQKQL